MGFIECVFKVGDLHECRPSWSWRVERMADFDLWLALGGQGSLESSGRSYAVSHGDCFLIPPGASLQASHDPERPLKVAAAHFDCLGGAFAETPAFHRNLGASTTLVSSLLLKAIELSKSGRKPDAGLWLGAALSAISDCDSESGRQRGALPAWNAAIKAAKERIERSPCRLDIAALARGAGLGRDHFSRVFKRATGKTPEAYAVERRMERARALLSISSGTISEIASELGYSSVFFFSRQFKERNGVSPRRFRESLSGSCALDAEPGKV